jgi:hypothetical protein
MEIFFGKYIDWIGPAAIEDYSCEESPKAPLLVLPSPPPLLHVLLLLSRRGVVSNASWTSVSLRPPSWPTS